MTLLRQGAQPARAAGVQVEFGGGVITALGASDSSIGTCIVIAYILLVIAFGSLLAAGVPLLMAVAGVGMLGLMALSGVVDKSATAPILATMLGLAVGIGDSLVIVSRHRQQLSDGLAPPESIRRATAASGSAVIFAGISVVIALAGLSIVNIPFLTVMGLAAAGTVAVSVLIAVTVLPAVLGFGGARLGRGQFRRNGASDPAPRMFLGWVRFVTSRPLPVLLVSVVGLELRAHHRHRIAPQRGAGSDSDRGECRARRRLGSGIAMALLQVENLSVRYGLIEVVRGASFEVEQGQIVALIGANGAGKTTILRAVSGVLRKGGGRVRFRDTDIANARPHRIVGL